MDLSTPAIVVAVLPHGEHGAVVRALTPGHGLLAGYVRGGRGRRLRPVLGLGNAIAAEFRARIETQLPALTIELAQSRAALAFDPLAAAALDWFCALTATALPEAQPMPQTHARLDALLTDMATAPPLAWMADLARLELSLLADLGFGLDLTTCAATGQQHDLGFVSPKSRTAVSRMAGLPYAARLLPFAPLLTGAPPVDWPEIADALCITGHFLARDLLDARAARILPARERLEMLVARVRVST